ncbi:M23 family metallopeptidase [Mesobacillus zeae]|uniref:LysM peptidoglycan-binding domain-containing protein n=1 Tax=Mesobacillus zeae TaxID=1917180 RepID=A0A398BD52_9BACI|nr:peptidoglycan DD-metalloendopeptidase family protein [Mesobacillus zeae]RID87331.1 LysM peptidoglycan-binding domain-containing protein [Mesobacillus zeae]
MRDYIRRILIAVLMGLCVSLLFLGGKHPEASTIPNPGKADHWIWPATGKVTDIYGTRGGKHKGIDIAGPLNNEVLAVDAGTVTKSYFSDSYGNVVFIKHDNGFETVYAHLEHRIAMEGQRVVQGGAIGRMGSTGDSSGVHLHFEVHHDKWTVNKENAVDPVAALGEVMEGQAVVAKTEGKGRAMEAAGNPIKHGADKPVAIETNANVHTVGHGETLWSIAQKYQTTVNELSVLNGIKENQIIVGQQLKLNSHSGGKQYMVTKGETLYSISRKTDTSVDRIKELNNLSGDSIKPDQVLIVK